MAFFYTVSLSRKLRTCNLSSSLKKLYIFLYNLRIIYLVGFQLQPMRLGKLENLDLSGNQLNNNILSILSGLSSLKSLDLSDNMLTGSGIIHSYYLNASHDILLIILFLYQQKWGLLYPCKDQFCRNTSFRFIISNAEAVSKKHPIYTIFKNIILFKTNKLNNYSKLLIGN